MEKAPDASTLSQNRIRRFNGTDVFQRILDRIVEQAFEQRLIGGYTLYMDSTHLKASANKRKAQNKEVTASTSAYIVELDKAIEADREAHGKKPLKEAKEHVSGLRLKLWGKKIYSRRKETVARRFADAKQHHGHRYTRFRGLVKEQMQCLLW